MRSVCRGVRYACSPPASWCRLPPAWRARMRDPTAPINPIRTNAPARGRREERKRKARSLQAAHLIVHPQAAHIPLQRRRLTSRRGSTGTAGFHADRRLQHHPEPIPPLHIYSGAPCPSCSASLVGRGHARGRPAGLPRLARLHPPDAPVRLRAVGPAAHGRARDRRRRCAARGIAHASCSRRTWPGAVGRPTPSG